MKKVMLFSLIGIVVVFAIVILAVIGNDDSSYSGTEYVDGGSGSSPSSTVAEEDASAEEVEESVSAVTESSSDSETTYTLEEVSSHDSRNDCWMVISGVVYDFTEYIATGRHNSEILDGCGIDATDMFNSERKHSGSEAQSLLEENKIGILG